jgi:hypothetical protein
MPIEVRQLLITSTVTPSNGPAPRDPVAPESLDRLREEILAECKLWLEEKLQNLRER